MLTIHGRVIQSADDPALNRSFGLCYKRSFKLDELIISIINDPWNYKFTSMENFRGFIVRRLRGRQTSLLLVNRHPVYNRGYDIIMTGSRTGDFAAANAKIKVSQTPANYTWHHAEGITRSRGKYHCTMYLILTSFHQAFPHFGGVKEYEILTGEEYK